MMFKKIVIAITGVLLLGLVVFLWNVNREEEKQTQKMEETDDARRPLEVKKQELEQQIIELGNLYEAERLPKGTTQVIFTGLEEEVYTVCYPIMKEHEYTGTLALSLTQFPGMEGFMTVEQFQQLINEGWDICIKWDAQNPVRNWWKQLQNKLKELELETGPIVYFTTGTYSKDMDAQLQNMGFSIVVHHGEDSTSLIQLADEEGIWHLGSVGLMGEKPKLRLTEAIAQKGNITYLVGFELEDEKYNERAFQSMLSYFDAYETNAELLVSNMEEARQHYRERSIEYEQVKEVEYQKAKAALEEQLAAVEAELAELEVK